MGPSLGDQEAQEARGLCSDLLPPEDQVPLTGDFATGSGAVLENLHPQGKTTPAT